MVILHIANIANSTYHNQMNLDLSRTAVLNQYHQVERAKQALQCSKCLILGPFLAILFVFCILTMLFYSHMLLQD